MAAAASSRLAVTVLPLKVHEVGIGLLKKRPDTRIALGDRKLLHIYDSHDSLIARTLALARRLLVKSRSHKVFSAQFRWTIRDQQR